MPRLFTGLELPEALAAELGTVRGGLAGARWINAEDYHITLRFIGDVDRAVASDVHDALSRIRRPAFAMTLGALDAFGGAKPRALVATARLAAPLVELQAEHERLMRRIGLPAETRKYVPHVTLARLRNTPSRAVADFLALRGWLAAREFRCDHFALFSARDSVGGGPYVTEAIYPLQ